MLLPRMFSSAGATGHVFITKHGSVHDVGLGYSGLIGPWSSVAVVPTMPQVVQFEIPERSVDNQMMSIAGNVSVLLNPGAAVKRYDFTVDPKNGGYRVEWDQPLQADVVKLVQDVIRETAGRLTIVAAVRSQQDFHDALWTKLQNAAVGAFRIDSCHIEGILPQDRDVGAAIGAEERLAILLTSDKAVHDRQMDAVAKQLLVGQAEAENKLKLERKREELIDAANANNLKQAEGDAKANDERLKSYQNLDPAMLLGIAAIEAGKSGRLGQLNIVPEIFGAAKAAARVS